MSKNFLKLKIESIAKKLLNKNQNQIINNDLKNDISINQLSSDESTIKDSLSEFEDLSKTINSLKTRNYRNKKVNNYFSKNSKQSNFTQSHQHSSLCTKMTSLTENNSGTGTLDYISKNLVDKNHKKSNELLIKNIIDNNVNNINLDVLNNLINIYNNLLELINFNKNYDKNEKNLNLNAESKNINNEIKILSYKYINFIFSNDMELLIKLFYNTIEIHKYFISQIYFFISLIYSEESILTNSYLLISYKSIVFYSLLNLEKIINIVNLPLLLHNDKILNSIKSVNKIILSILKIINPKVPSNSQIMDFISPVKLNQTNNNTTTTNRIKSSGVLKLVNLLKVNSNLNDKLFKIEMQKLSNIENNTIKDNKSSNNDNKNNIEKEQKKELIQNNILNTETLNKPILPPMDENKYKYTIALELDETLVHYCEEGENYYAKVRFGTENFLKNISNCFEIIVVSTSGKEYSDIIIDNINKDDKCYVEHRIYTEAFKKGLDLSNLNRDVKRLMFVCHEYNFLKAPKENIILLKEFKGEEDDREIIKLYNELKLLNNDNKIEKNFDIRDLIPTIMQRISLNNDNIDYLEEEGEDEYDNDENNIKEEKCNNINGAE